MNYQEALAKAKKAGSVNRLSSNRKDLAIGDEIVGKFLHRDLIKSKQKEYPDSYRYSFDLDEGPADLFFSGHFDKTVGADFHEGCVYHIRYDDKLDIGKNQTFKKYTVEEIIFDESETTQENES